MKSILVSVFLFVASVSTVLEQLVITEHGITIKKISRDDYSLSYVDDYFINEHKLTILFDQLNREIYTQPINAKFNDQGEIVDGIPGTVLNRNKAKSLFYEFYYSGGPLAFEVPKSSIHPKVTSELLAEISVNEIGRYVTYYNVSNRERSHNIALAAAAIDNYVVFPGEKFSFNKIVGERTVEKGYLRAPVIVKGEYAEDIGGGICQVSSTLFNAVELRGIQIIERYTHSRSVPYVPPGKDATVSWWGPDFVFKNVYSHPILIRAKSAHGTMVVTIYSAEDVKYKG